MRTCKMETEQIYNQLKSALEREIEKNDLKGTEIRIVCRSLSSSEAIGNPEHDDYPIIKGKEVMIEAAFRGIAGQAFTDEFKNMSLPVEALLDINTGKQAERAAFIAGLNAIYRYLRLCSKTIHCKDEEPLQCAQYLASREYYQGKKILLVGLQPRFLEFLGKNNFVRVLDLDPDNIDKERFGVTIESGENPAEAIEWCDAIFATGSTIVNGTISHFTACGKPVEYYGVTIQAAARILDLQSYCHCGR